MANVLLEQARAVAVAQLSAVALAVAIGFRLVFLALFAISYPVTLVACAQDAEVKQQLRLSTHAVVTHTLRVINPPVCTRVPDGA